MCGICLVVVDGAHGGHESVCRSEALQQARALLSLRGPDSLRTESFWGSDEGGAEELKNGQVGVCMASVLHMRGAAVQPQPMHGEDGSFLCWNGEVFAGNVEVAEHDNDGLAVFQCLYRAEKSAPNAFSPEEVLRGVEGPFSFVYWQASMKRLWFGRDPMGRRSLLVCRPRDLGNGSRQVLAVSSVAFSVDREERDWVEVPTSGIYNIDLPVTAQDVSFAADSTEEDCFGALSTAIHLKFMRWELPRAAVLPARTVEVVTGSDTPFRIEVPAMYLPRGSRQEPQERPAMCFEEAVRGFEAVLSNAVMRRVKELPEVSHGARVAVLFSGGLDSMVLAGLVDDSLSQGAGIDLINVAFGAWPYDVPDRKTGRASARVLRKRSPQRPWRFIEVNISDTELKEHEELLDTVWPRGTVMDMTIGPALWFAARGRGIVQCKDVDDEQGHVDKGNYEEAQSLAKVLLLGHGADEQLAGYGRHRNAWKKRGYDGINLELDKDTARLWIRNLGRDDRVISSLGKESRLPYLDRDVMEFLSALDADVICDFELPVGVGDKRILREVARRLRLTEASDLPKRALQFGSRISRLTNSKNGGHVPFEGYR